MNNEFDNKDFSESSSDSYSSSYEKRQEETIEEAKLEREKSYQEIKEERPEREKTYEEINRDYYDNGYYKKESGKEKKKSKAGKYIAFALIFSILGSLIGSTLGYKLAADKFSKMASSGPNYTISPTDDPTTVTAVATANLDSVVGITTKTFLRNFFNQQYESEAMGSGFIVDEKGYIVTNNHVIESLDQQQSIFGPAPQPKESAYADEITVLLNDGSQLPAKVVWADKSLDLAVLKVESDKALKPVKLGDSSKLVIGEQAIAIGNPLAIEFHGTVTAGYISGLDRKLQSTDGTEMNLIQTDASINPGNSGGPLLNAKGEVIGINTMKITSGEGLGFSIPINVVKPIVDQIIKTGSFEKVTLGFSGADLEKYEQNFQVDTGLDGGVVVMQVYEGSPIQKAGIKQLDIITKVGGKEIKVFQDILPLLYNYKIGDDLEIEYVRDNKTEKTTVHLEKFQIKENN